MAKVSGFAMLLCMLCLAYPGHGATRKWPFWPQVLRAQVFVAQAVGDQAALSLRLKQLAEQKSTERKGLAAKESRYRKLAEAIALIEDACAINATYGHCHTTLDELRWEASRLASRIIRRLASKQAKAPYLYQSLIYTHLSRPGWGIHVALLRTYAFLDADLRWRASLLLHVVGRGHVPPSKMPPLPSLPPGSSRERPLVLMIKADLQCRQERFDECFSLMGKAYAALPRDDYALASVYEAFLWAYCHTAGADYLIAIGDVAGFGVLWRRQGPSGGCSKF